MSMKISFTTTPPKSADTAVILVYSGNAIGGRAAALDKQTGGFISHALKKRSKFKAKAGETLTLSLPPKAPYVHAVLVGMGDADKLDALKAEEAGGKLCLALKAAGAENAALLADGHTKLKGLSEAALAAHLANGLKLRSYSFDRYKSKVKDDNDGLKSVQIVTAQQAKAADAFERLDCVTEGVFWARNLVNEPPNELFPVSFAKQIVDELEPLGVEIDVLDEKEMKKRGMGALLAVAIGSEQKPRMVVMRWHGGKGKKAPKSAPIAFVGKGVTFDTGGISLKPGAGMEEMKMDMGGAAAVVGLMKTLALRKSKANVVGVVGLVENMPSGHAYRPADIITSLSGKTIEVLNTDAEGRLVLADCLTHVQRTYKPSVIVDLATLTGAILVALGHEYCGTFANDDKLWHQMEKASAATGEKLWRMPLDPAWKKDMESPTADLQNISKSGRNAGSCTAAGFLEHFIEGKTSWVHMDIAGTAWHKADKPTVPKFGTGFGVRILDRLVADYYEKA